MNINGLNIPITIATLSEMEVSLNELSRKLSNYYHEYKWDNYLLQQNKIELIADALGNDIYSNPEYLMNIYQGKVNDGELKVIFPDLPVLVFEKIKKLKPTRKRCISEYTITCSTQGKLTIERIPSKDFGQDFAEIASNTLIDYRKSKRTFKELPNELYDDNLKKIISYFSNKVILELGCKKLNMVVHHTLVFCFPNIDGANSPEGIHQDGMDYIVSALVIERKNISGGKSIIYGPDKATRLLECELQEGMGLFQADRNTNLWHEVTHISPVIKDKEAYRSLIGLDITIES